MISDCVSALDKHNHISSHLPNTTSSTSPQTHTHISPLTLMSTLDESSPLDVGPVPEPEQERVGSQGVEIRWWTGVKNI